jgi:hypothetical protein
MFSLHFHYSCRNCRSRVEVCLGLYMYILNFTLGCIRECSAAQEMNKFEEGKLKIQVNCVEGEILLCSNK